MPFAAAFPAPMARITVAAPVTASPPDVYKRQTMSKGTKEKVQLILVMSRRADLYILDEPIAGVDPAARDYICLLYTSRCV